MSLGARAIVHGLLPEILRTRGDDFVALLPDLPEFRAISFPSNANVAFTPRWPDAIRSLRRFRELHWDVASFARAHAVDCCLTLGDLAPIGIRCPHVVFLQQSLSLYSLREQGGARTWSMGRRLYVRRHMTHMALRVSRYIVQTPVMAARLGSQYGIPEERVHVVAQPAPVRAGEPGAVAADPRIASCPKPHRLLFLAAGYRHKNHAVLENVVLELSQRSLSKEVQIFVTLDPSEVSPRLAGVLRRHPDVVTNLMRLPPTEVAAALNASTGLFLPSLAESYGLVYVEALAVGLPILTSDRDFARWMCGDLAVYFDPLNASSIVDAIEAYPRKLPRGADLALSAAERLLRFPRHWSEVAARFLAITTGAT